MDQDEMMIAFGKRQCCLFMNYSTSRVVNLASRLCFICIELNYLTTTLNTLIISQHFFFLNDEVVK